MKRLDPALNGGSTQYIDGNPTTGAGGTVLQADALNHMQEEIAAVIEHSGGVLNPASKTQMRDKLVALVNSAGSVSFFATPTAPTGWLKANGAAVSRAAYGSLFAAIGTSFGVGDGSTTFNLPDLRGEFLRGFDDGRGADAGRLLGSAQLATRIRTFLADQALNDTDAPSSFSSILGIVSGEQDQFGLAPNGQDKAAAGGTFGGVYADNVAWGGRGTVSAGGPQINSFFTVRPRNVALLACIKF